MSTYFNISTTFQLQNSCYSIDVCAECFCTHLLIVMNYVYIVLLHSLQNGNTPLIAASQKGHKDIVEVLLNHGAEVDLPDKVSVFVSCGYLNFHAV